MITVIVFLVLLIVSFKPTNNNDYLDCDRTFGVRGIMMVAICFSHILPFDNGNYLLRFLFPATVAPFFFYSGFGLAIKTESSYISGRSGYLNDFFKKRLSRMACTCLITNTIFVVIKGGYRLYLSFNQAMLDFVNIGWFATALIIDYIAFYFIYKQRLLNNFKYNAMAMLLYNVLYIIVCRVMGLSSTWYGNSFAFVLGVYWAHYREQANEMISKHYAKLLLLIMSIIIMSNLIILYREEGIISISGLGMIAAFLLGIAYPIMWNLILYKFDFRNKIWYLIGTISFELYMIEKLSHPSVYWMMDKVKLCGDEIAAVGSLMVGIIYSVIVYHLSAKLKTIVNKGKQI